MLPLLVACALPVRPEVVLVVDPAAPGARALPAAAVEEDAARRAFGAELRVLRGPEATEAALVRSLRDREIGLVQLAATVASDGAALLAPGPGDDGRLEPAELASLEVHGTVVVLSLRGPGSAEGLARALLAAGAAAVVAPAAGTSEAEVARRASALDEALARGENLGTAVARAGLVLRGDPSRTPCPSGSAGGWALGVALAGSLAAAATLAGARRRDRR